MSPGDFVAPDWSAPLDVASYVDSTPKGARIKGMFPGAVADSARARGVPLPSARERYLPFADVPVTEFAMMLVEAAQGFFPNVPLRSGLRELGRSAYPVLVQSMVGKVMLSTAADMPSGVTAAVKAYGVALPQSKVEIVELSKQRAVITLRHIYYFLDSHHVGCFEGLARSMSVRLTTRIRMRSKFDGDFELSW
jgi:uncharacterized protein (TIGR02265 family)